MKTSTMEDLEEYLIFHGHRMGCLSFHTDEKLGKAIREISDYIPKEPIDVSFSRISHFRMVADAKRFFHEHFKLHDVGYLKDKKLLKKLNGKDVSSTYDIAKIYNSSAKMVSPFKLPLKYLNSSFYDASLVHQTIDVEDPSLRKELFSQLNVYFTGIILPKILTPIATPIYIHEITHTQVSSWKGVIEDYYNVEVLSIFTELLYSYYNDPLLFQTEFMLRLDHLKKCSDAMLLYDSDKGDLMRKEEISEVQYHSNAQYLISTFKALNMLQLYVGSDEDIQSYILECCQKVFDGDCSLEEALSRLDVTTDDSIHSRYVKGIFKTLK